MCQERVWLTRSTRFAFICFLARSAASRPLSAVIRRDPTRPPHLRSAPPVGGQRIKISRAVTCFSTLHRPAPHPHHWLYGFGQDP